MAGQIDTTALFNDDERYEQWLDLEKRCEMQECEGDDVAYTLRKPTWNDYNGERVFGYRQICIWMALERLPVKARVCGDLIDAISDEDLYGEGCDFLREELRNAIMKKLFRDFEAYYLLTENTGLEEAPFWGTPDDLEEAPFLYLLVEMVTDTFMAAVLDRARRSREAQGRIEAEERRLRSRL